VRAKAESRTPETIEKIGLYEILKQWRTTKAGEMNTPAFVVLHNTALAEIAAKLPATKQDLSTIKGLKSKKGKVFGDEILQLVARYMSENNLPLPDTAHESEAGEPVSKKKGKSKTRQESLRLFLEGKSVAGVAGVRGLALSTIEGHLAYFVGTGELDIERLVEPEKAARISAYFLKSKDPLLGPAKAAMGDDVSFGELRFVLNYLERGGKF
jgi:hypothetical protein